MMVVAVVEAVAEVDVDVAIRKAAVATTKDVAETGAKTLAAEIHARNRPGMKFPQTKIREMSLGAEGEAIEIRRTNKPMKRHVDVVDGDDGQAERKNLAAIR